MNRFFRMAPAVLVGVGLCALMAAQASAGVPAGDPGKGKAMFESHCMACHSLDQNRVGPKLGGVYGRKAGTAPNFDYSPAVKNSGIVWTAENINKWLSGPQNFIPGQKMNFSIDNPQDRADIIAFLKTQK